MGLPIALAASLPASPCCPQCYNGTLLVAPCPTCVGVPRLLQHLVSSHHGPVRWANILPIPMGARSSERGVARTPLRQPDGKPGITPRQLTVPPSGQGRLCGSRAIPAKGSGELQFTPLRTGHPRGQDALRPLRPRPAAASVGVTACCTVRGGTKGSTARRLRGLLL